MTTPPVDSHEWVSFEDPDEQRTWIFDVTFLMSNWACIFGRGCKGVLTGPAEELAQGCCSYGAHFTGPDDLANTERAAAGLTSEQWQFIDRGRTKTGKLKIHKVNDEGETVTRQVDGACIFLNRPGFGAGPGCALHAAALARGDRPLDDKPHVCWQLPLRREDNDDGDGHVTSRLIQWDRRHWGEGGQEFHWWCTEAPDAFADGRAVYQTMRDEIIEMIGQTPYDMLVRYLKSRPAQTFLLHPATRLEISVKPKT